MEYIPFIGVILACFWWLGHHDEAARRTLAARQRLAKRKRRGRNA